MEVTIYGYGIISETTAMSGVVKRDGKVIKKFRGETAWMDAERYANDLAVEARYA